MERYGRRHSEDGLIQRQPAGAGKGKDMGSQDYGTDPTPEEIEEMTRKLKDSWTLTEERRHRTGSGKKVPYTVPNYAPEVLLGKGTVAK